MNPLDPIAALLTGPLTATGGPGQAMSYRQGIIEAFDPVTGANRVNVGGAQLVDLPILGGAEILTYRPGAVVGVACVGSSWAIMGRFTIPGTPDYTDVVTLLSQKTQVDLVNVQEGTNSTSYTDLATVGPTVTVDVGASGRVLMILSCKGGWSVGGADVASGARMSAALSGANTLAAATTWACWTYMQHGGTTFSTVDGSPTSAYVFEGLAPGATTFQAKYRSDTGGVTVDFTRRTIVVIAL